MEVAVRAASLGPTRVKRGATQAVGGGLRRAENAQRKDTHTCPQGNRRGEPEGALPFHRTVAEKMVITRSRPSA